MFVISVVSDGLRRQRDQRRAGEAFLLLEDVKSLWHGPRGPRTTRHDRKLENVKNAGGRYAPQPADRMGPSRAGHPRKAAPYPWGRGYGCSGKTETVHYV
eukprot:4041291-Pyramimonas_sp.AAC.1